MPFSITSRILHSLESTTGISFTQIETKDLLGRPYKVIKGTLRSQVDYDDAWLLSLAQEASIVFDIGSNIGQAALLILHPGCVQEILLVDPNPEALGQAAQNLILNNWSHRARFICAFASNQADQRIEFFTVGAGAAGSMYASHARTGSRLNSKFSVPTVTIDALVKMYGCSPDLVKIDTEGAERLVLQGASGLAQKRATRFFVEMHSNADLTMAENVTQVLAWCQQVDYQAWYLKEKTRLTDPEIIARRGRCHLLLIPNGENLPPRLLHLEQGAPLEKVYGKHVD